MGNSSVLAILGLLALFSIVNTTLNQKNFEAVDNAAGYAEYTIARDIARSSIHIALRTVDTSAVLPFNFTLEGVLHSGEYFVEGTSSGDTLWLNGVGSYNDTLYQIRTTLLRFPKPFPGSAFDAALGLRPSPLQFGIQGNSALVDGRNHDSTGALTINRDEDVPGVMCMSPSDSVIVSNGTQNINTNLNGSQKIGVNPNITDPETFVDEMQVMADYKYQTPPNNDLTVGSSAWGSQTNPVIVYVDARDTNKVKFAGNSVGWGILVVRGSVEVTGTMRWNGLVVAYGNTVIDFKTSGGTSTVLGSFLFGGAPTSKFEMKGTGQILYSNRTLLKAKNVNKLLAYKILDWYETAFDVSM